MAKQNLATVTNELIASYGNTAKNVILAYRTGGERLVGGLHADAVRRDHLLVDEAVEHVVGRVVLDDLARRKPAAGQL